MKMEMTFTQVRSGEVGGGAEGVLNVSTIHDIVVKASFVLKESPCRHARRWLWGGGARARFRRGKDMLPLPLKRTFTLLSSACRGDVLGVVSH